MNNHKIKTRESEIKDSLEAIKKGDLELNKGKTKLSPLNKFLRLTEPNSKS